MNINPKQFDITIECGADFSLNMAIRNSEDALVDLTGCTVSAQLREYPEASDYIAFTATHNGEGGKITLSMAHESTAQVGYSAGYYDCFVTFPDTSVQKVLWGEVTVIPAVTKPIDGTVMILLSFGSESAFPLSGLVDRIYFSHASSKMYRWNGTGYVNFVTNGIDGVDGISPTIEIQGVTTLPAGSSATVENVGTENHAKFKFGIPKGYDGDYQAVQWGNIGNKPEYFPPSEHNHDERYYQQTEVDDLLDGKADSNSTIPSGGTTGQVLKKTSNDDYDADWDDEAGGGTWGSISGDLEDQTDLQDALDEKANSADLGGIVVRPDYTISNVDLTDGTSPLESGKLYFYVS